MIPLGYYCYENKNSKEILIFRLYILKVKGDTEYLIRSSVPKIQKLCKIHRERSETGRRMRQTVFIEMAITFQCSRFWKNVETSLKEVKLFSNFL
jgi:hypothetical protein